MPGPRSFTKSPTYRRDLNPLAQLGPDGSVGSTQEQRPRGRMGKKPLTLTEHQSITVSTRSAPATVSSRLHLQFREPFPDHRRQFRLGFHQVARRRPARLGIPARAPIAPQPPGPATVGRPRRGDRPTGATTRVTTPGLYRPAAGDVQQHRRPKHRTASGSAPVALRTALPPAARGCRRRAIRAAGARGSVRPAGAMRSTSPSRPPERRNVCCLGTRVPTLVPRCRTGEHLREAGGIGAGRASSHSAWTRERRTTASPTVKSQRRSIASPRSATGFDRLAASRTASKVFIRTGSRRRVNSADSRCSLARSSPSSRFSHSSTGTDSRFGADSSSSNPRSEREGSLWSASRSSVATGWDPSQVAWCAAQHPDGPLADVRPFALSSNSKTASGWWPRLTQSTARGRGPRAFSRQRTPTPAPASQARAESEQRTWLNPQLSSR